MIRFGYPDNLLNPYSVIHHRGKRRYCTDKLVITWGIRTAGSRTRLEPCDDEVIVANMYAVTLMQYLILLRLAIHKDAVRTIEILYIG